mmetsp:Transcript_18308/g.41867  ORF Transcript_18308/g.41867 Transcript_18308/m.41867 type:complete len:487 (-) Transcript_18308:3814-5274(-)
MDVLPPGHRAPPRTMARKSTGPTVRGTPLQGICQKRYQAAYRVPFRPGAAGPGHARYPGHDAGRDQGQQVQSHPQSPQRGFPLLEGQHPLESARDARSRRKYDPALRQGQSRLVDQHRTLQSRTDQTGRHRGQDRGQEKSRTSHPSVAQGGAGAAAQLSQGRALRLRRGGGGHLHHHRPLAGIAQVRAHTLPAPELQTRHQTAHPGPGADEGTVRARLQAQQRGKGGAGAHRTGLRQSPRGAVQDQTASADHAHLQGGHHRIHGHVLPSQSRLWDRTPGKNHRRLSGPISVVRGGQTWTLSLLDQTRRQRTSPSPDLQVVPGHQQPRGSLGNTQGRMCGHGTVQIRKGLRKGRPHPAQSTSPPHRRPQHRRLHDGQEQCQHLLQRHDAHQLLRAHPRPPFLLFHLPILQPGPRPPRPGADPGQRDRRTPPTSQRLPYLRRPRHGDGPSHPTLHALPRQGLHAPPLRQRGQPGPHPALPHRKPRPQQ